MEKMLFATSNSRSEPLKYINDELKNVENCVSGYIKIIEKREITYTKLKKAIEDYNDITMLHYSGHSDKDGFNIDKDGNTVDISKEDIANLVKSCPNLRLVFFNSCWSEDFANEIFKINPNIPYVIGTKKAVNDYLASLVAFVFYRNLTIDSSRNIELAFNLTRAELEDNYDNVFENILSEIKVNNLEKGKEELITNTRSLGKREQTRFWWEKHENPAISALQKEWTLVPKANLVLSDKENKDKVKILCLYERKYKDDIKLIISNLTNNSDYVFHGIWDIWQSENSFNINELNDEMKIADYILHFTSGSLYVDFIKHLNIESLVKSKNNLFLSFIADFNFKKEYSWYDDTNFIDLSGMTYHFFTNGWDEDKKTKLIKNSMLISIISIIEKSGISPEKIKEDLTKMDFFAEMSGFDGKSSTFQKTNLFQTVVNGTIDDAQVLFVNKLRKKIKLNENSFEKINLDCEALGINNEDEEKIEEKLWSQFISEVLKTKIDVDKTNIEIFKTMILTTLVSKAESMSITIIFDRVSPKVKKVVDEQIWAVLNTKAIKNKIWFFSINYEENNSLSNSNLTFENQIDIKISSYNKTEFDNWKGNVSFVKNHPCLLKLGYNDIKNTKRKLVLTELCSHFIADENKKNKVINELLQHD